MSSLFAKAAQAALEFPHLQNLEQLFRVIREAASKRFYEDNAPTVNALLVELLDKSNPYPDVPFFNEAGKQLLAEKDAEIARLKGVLNMPTDSYTHQCRACDQRYNPEGRPSEDCPRCGSDGRDPATGEPL